MFKQKARSQLSLQQVLGKKQSTFKQICKNMLEFVYFDSLLNKYI